MSARREREPDLRVRGGAEAAYHALIAVTAVLWALGMIGALAVAFATTGDPDLDSPAIAKLALAWVLAWSIICGLAVLTFAGRRDALAHLRRIERQLSR